MGDEQIRVKVTGDWLWVYGLFKAVATLIPPNPDGIRLAFSTQPAGFKAAVYHGVVRKRPVTAEDGTPMGAIVPLVDNAAGSFMGTIEATGEGATVITAIPAAPEHGAYWNQVVAAIRHATADVRMARRVTIGLRLDEVLDDYYAAIVRGEAPNLHDMARTAGVNYGSLRQAKIRYDKKRHGS